MLTQTFIDAELETRLRLALVSGTKVVAALTLDDIDDLAGHVAARANHCEDAKGRRVLDAVYDRLTTLEATYTDIVPGVGVSHVRANREFDGVRLPRFGCG